MKQAMCEYSMHPHDEQCANKPVRFYLASHPTPMHTSYGLCSQLSPLALYSLFLAGTTTTPLYALLRPDPHSIFFCSVTHWSVALYSHTHSSTCFPSHRPSTSTSSFDLVYILLSSPSLLPSSGPPSGLEEAETSHTSFSCSLSPLLPNVFDCLSFLSNLFLR